MVRRDRSFEDIRDDALQVGARKLREGCDGCAEGYFALARRHGASDEDIERVRSKVAASATTPVAVRTRGGFGRRGFLKTAALSMASASAAATSAFTFDTRLAFAASGEPPSLSGVALEDSEGRVVAKCGKPQRIVQAQGSGMPEWQYPGMLVRLWSSSTGAARVRQIIVMDPRHGGTTEGLRVGSDISEVTRTYGGSLIDFGSAGFTVPLAPGARLDIQHAQGVVTLMALQDTTCATCQVLVGPPGPGKTPPKEGR